MPAVIVISALVMLLILFAFWMRTLDFQYHNHYRDLKQSRLDLHSVANLYMCDSMLLSRADSSRISLYEEGKDEITVKRKRWGLYEAVSIRHSKEDPFGRIHMMGKAEESSCRAALWLCDRNIPLTLAGNTSIKGTVYIPQNGIKSIEIAKRKYHGESPALNQMRVSDRSMPKVNQAFWTYLDSLKQAYETSVDYRLIEEQYVSFDKPTVFSHCHTCKETCLRQNGNIVLFGDRLVISKESDIHDILILARSVVIESGFRGNAQIICADSILLKPHVELTYPSGLFVDSSGQNAPCVTIGEYCKVAGYVGVHWSEKYHYVLENACCRLRQNALVCGLVYVDGSCEINGCIKGAAYIKDCFYREGHSFYAETLFDVSIERSDSLSYPILLEGPYRRQIIKNLY